MAGANIAYDAGQFTWAYTKPIPDPFPATQLILKWGTVTGVYPNVKSYGLATVGDAVHNVLPAGSAGQFFAIMVVANAKEGPKSSEVPFVLSDGAPGGSVTFSIG